MSKHRFPTFLDYLRDKFKDGPFLATDVLIEYTDPVRNKEGLVLIERLNTPYGLALPGGIAEEMTLPDNARKEAMEETGLALEIYQPEEKPFSVLSDPQQDPRAFIVSVTYRAKGLGMLKAGDDAKAARVYAYRELGDLVRDEKIWAMPHHRKIVDLYVQTLRTEGRI